MDVNEEVRSVAIALGAVIRNERRMLSITQENLSEFSGLDRTFISTLESGKGNPSLLTVARLAIAFNRRLDDFLELIAHKSMAARQVQLMLPLDENPAAPLLQDEEKVKETIEG